MVERLASIDGQAPDRLARRFFFACVGELVITAGLAWLLIEVFPRPAPVGDKIGFPAAFWLSTPLLLAGSLLLHRATGEVRREHQRAFRRALLGALAAGTLFIGVQSCGLWQLLQQQNGADVQTGVGAFVLVFATLHGLHFVVATLFLLFVTVRACADRYDHEYYWGVVVCGFFWHALGVVWLAILGVFAIVTLA